MVVERWTLPAARERLAVLRYEAGLGAGAELAAVVVDVGDDPADDVGSALTDLPLVAIAVGTGGESWDVATAEDPAPLLAGLERAPHAAVVAAQVFRVADQNRRIDMLRDRHLGNPDDVARAEAVAAELRAGLLMESLAYATLQGGPDHDNWLRSHADRSPKNVSECGHHDDKRERVIVTDDHDRVTITLNRPQLANAFDAAMRDQLADALRAIAADPARRPLLIRGAESTFCAGGDLNEFGTVSDPSTAHLLRSTTAVAPLLLQVADRTTAFIDGACVGAGIELAAFCKRIEVTPSARFRLPEVSMGLLPGVGGTVSIPRRIGRQKTLEWLISNRDLDAQTALEWGLADALVE